ncbi:MAG: fimbrillin family protein [Rikenellaceae bacterium]
MKSKNIFNKLVAIVVTLFVAFGLASCSQKDDVVDADNYGSQIKFTASVKSDNQTTTRGALYDESNFQSFKVYAYNSASADWFIDGKLMTKSDDGSWSMENSESYTFPATGTTTFYAVSADAPSGEDFLGVTFDKTTLEVDYEMQHLLQNQPSLLIADEVSFESGATGVVKFDFNVALTAVRFTKQGDFAISALNLSGIATDGTFSASDGSLSEIGETVSDKILNNPGYAGLGTPTNSNLTDFFMLPPQNVSNVAVKASLTYNNEDVDPKTVTFSGNLLAAYYYTLDIDTGEYVEPTPDVPASPFESGDYTSMESANCYILNPTDEARVFYIPVEDRINTFWGKTSNYYEENSSYHVNTTGTNWTPSILWADVSNYANVIVERVNSGFESDNCNSAMKVTLPANFNASNIVVGVKISSTIVWSWHLWVTDYNPYIEPTSKGNGAYSVENGELFRFEDNDSQIYLPNNAGYNITGRKNLWENGGDYVNGYIMDRNIGATASDASGYGTSYAGKGSLYYQFGRKDPFPGNATTYGPNQPAFFSGYSQMASAVNKPYNFVGYGKSEWYLISDLNNIPKYAKDNVFWRDPAISTTIKEVSGSGFYGNYFNNISWSYEIYLDPNKKSIFDPSPLGWKIPHFMTWSNISNDGNEITGGIECKGCKFYKNGFLSKSSGNVINNSYDVYSWSNYPLQLIEISGYTAVYTFQGSGLWYGNNGYGYGVTECEEISRATGLPVRPVRDLSIEF